MAESTWRATSATGTPSATVMSSSASTPSSRRTDNPGVPRPRRSIRRAIGPPANPVTPYEPRVAVRTTSRRARPVTSERPGVGRMATLAGVLPRGLGDGVARSVCYITVPLGLPGSGLPSDHVPEDSHGPLLRDLRQGLDGWV